MAVTLQNIADRAGVSVVTVSRALNDKPDINSQTKQKILEIADELDYTPNAVAQSLKTSRSHMIGILIPNTTDYFFATIIQGISEYCYTAGYGTVLCNFDNDREAELGYLKDLQSRRVDGLLIYPEVLDEEFLMALEKISIPSILLNRYSERLTFGSVVNDYVQGAFLAVDFLLQQGHRDILHITAKPDVYSGKERITGCQKAYNENQVPLDRFRIKECEDSIKSCYELTKELLQSELPATAIFNWNDKLTLGCYKALNEEGVKIPDDISLIGYDDIESAAYYCPPLTTIRQPIYQVGERSAKTLIQSLETKSPIPSQQIILMPELIKRASTRALSGQG